MDTVTDRPVRGLRLGWPFVILGRTPSPDGGARVPPYRRRRRTPWVVVVSVLAVLAVTTWTVVLIGAGGSSGVTSCPAPTGSGPSGQVVDPGALDAVAPVPPSAARVRVFNAGGQRGQANLVAAQLGDLGFPEAASPDNDPLYPDGNMECVGQLRFGPTGEGAARTLSLVLPCTELVRDDRTDDVVDIAVGTGFRDVNPPRAVRNALDQIGTGGGTDGSANADPSAPGASTAATRPWTRASWRRPATPAAEPASGGAARSFTAPADHPPAARRDRCWWNVRRPPEAAAARPSGASPADGRMRGR